MPVFSPWPLPPVPPTTITGPRGPLKPLPTPSKAVPAHHPTPRGHTVGGGEEARPTQRRRSLPLPLPAHSPHLPSARRRPAPNLPSPPSPRARPVGARSVVRRRALERRITAATAAGGDPFHQLPAPSPRAERPPSTQPQRTATDVAAVRQISASVACTVGPNSCSFWHRVHGPKRVESIREATFFVHEVLHHVHLLVLVKHCEVRKRHKCLLSVHMHTHSRRRPWRRLLSVQ